MRDLVAKQSPLAAVVPADQLLEAFQEFMRLDVAQGDASPETVRTYWGQVQAFVAWCEEERIEPSLASHDDLKAYRSALIEDDYARSTIAGRLNSVRRFYEMARARGFRHDNPAEGLKAPRDLSEGTARVKWLPLGAVQRLLDAPDATQATGIRDRAILLLLTVHGLRRMEVARLQIDDLDLEGLAISILGKGRKRRRVPLVEETTAAIKAWLELRAGLAAPRETAVFVATHGGGNGGPGHAMSRRSINRLVDGYLEHLGLKRDGISCHALRHSYATLSLAAGARLDVISRTLGHASVTTTQVYADIIDIAAQNPARFLVGALEAAS
jgi:site-specific recombinase XerD